ncbi:MAG: methyltransferase FkbM family, partial [Candidatus Eremiobacteraeota bacterium]|nr:methyltransferase FkbM family [Candidatus Eremiobacteraeota bacterium]
MSTAMGSLLSAHEALHVRRAVFGAPLRHDPSPYAYVENVFTPQTYASILRLFPTGPDVLRRWSNPGEPALRFGSYEQRREINLNEDADRLPPGQREFWSALTAFLCGPGFARTLLDRFGDFARARFGAELDDPAFVEERLRGTAILNEHDPGYYLGPHTDRSEKVFTVLLYFPEREGLDHLGTTLYRPLEPGFTCDGRGHYDPARFERGETIPYRPNSALIFARTGVMFHGVHRLSEEDLQGSRRRSIQMQFWLRNARPREACKVRLHTAIPPAMRAGAEHHLSYQLTNRAAAELVSELPYATQLGYRWTVHDGHPVEPGAPVRTPLPQPLAPGAAVRGDMRVVAPRVPGRYVLRLSVVQEGVAWFDDIDPDNGATDVVTVWDAGAVSPHNVVPETNGVALGDGWYPLERADGAAFRWVNDRAVVHVAALEPLHHALCLLVEPGPGTAGASLRLTARLDSGMELGTALVSTRQLVKFALPPRSPSVLSVVLHAENGGTPSPGDPRILNFRVFRLCVERFADVFPAWAKPAHGFYPLEREGASAFRWARSDATVTLAETRGDALAFDVEPGPGSDPVDFTVHAAGADGEAIARATVAGRTQIRVPLGALGDGWYALERADGAAFRWVNDRAVVHVAALEPLHHALCLLVEPGPGTA